MKLGHIGLPVADIKAAQVFYDSIATSIGLARITEHEDFVGYGSGDLYDFYIHTGKPGIQGLHICFEVTSEAAVQEFYERALAAGGVDNGAPGIRADYGTTYYAAFVIDPNGNNIETVYRG